MVKKLYYEPLSALIDFITSGMPEFLYSVEYFLCLKEKIRFLDTLNNCIFLHHWINQYEKDERKNLKKSLFPSKLNMLDADLS